MADEVQQLPDDAKVVPIPLDPVHASSIEVGAAGNDLTLFFGTPRYSHITLPTNERFLAADVQVVSAVTMSIASAKDLLQVLGNVVQQLEAQFGSSTTAYLKALSERTK